jgi:hypothetical protein
LRSTSPDEASRSIEAFRDFMREQYTRRVRIR